MPSRYTKRRKLESGYAPTKKKKRSVRYWRSGYDRVGGLYRMGRKKKFLYNNELKFADQELKRTATTGGFGFRNDQTNSLCDTIVNTPRGTAAFNRIGDRITIRRIQFRMSLIWSFNSAIPYSAFGGQGVIRIMLVRDRQSNGTPPAVSGILTSYTTEPIFLQFRDLENRDRYEILWDKTYSFNPSLMRDLTLSTNLIPLQKTIKGNIKCEIPVVFDSNDPNAFSSSIKTNNIYFVACTNTNSYYSGGFEESFNVFGFSRIRYDDY